ncbi:TrmH family RNA methyltransferase [Spongiivirga citrea]|uniref:tRNA (guanosine(18)-2'-O)-methyltransferase n=1 Tax=Spongiivirga citrea TaxID=1481457 RepID=A0A6M0CPZ2_9FLAO|nr:RNA methyltransferase [Spongiivirga citrea]NER17939.1 TrmH family RNA methyltransferase [Spongiivirga citrea]
MVDIKLLQYLEGFLTERRRGLFTKVLANRTRHFTVAVEDVYQLHNTSAVLRSCDVFGIQDCHVIEEHNSKKMDREIAMGAQKWVDVKRYNHSSECINHLKNEGYQIIATSPHEKSSTLSDFDITKKSALFFGRETEGLSEEVLSAADGFLHIPMVGFTESLNISVSAAITLQHLTERLRKSDMNWQLSEEEILEQRMQWVQKSIKSIDQILEKYEKEK